MTPFSFEQDLEALVWPILSLSFWRAFPFFRKLRTGQREAQPAGIGMPGQFRAVRKTNGQAKTLAWFPLVFFGFLWFPFDSFSFLWFPLPATSTLLAEERVVLSSVTCRQSKRPTTKIRPVVKSKALQPKVTALSC